MKISWITTVLNERATLDRFLNAITDQSLPPDEIIIVDGGSTDGTYEALQSWASQVNGPKVLILKQEGNRSVGRNTAIEKATGDVIVCTDAGSFAEKHWVDEITKPFSVPTVDVVAGYYEAKTDTIFQECLVPYVFIMPDKIRQATFLPAARSMAFTKTIWEKAGRFPEQYSHNEDYVFARTLRNLDAKIVFRKEAIVYWIPRKNFYEAYIMFYRFALGDAEARIFRPKVFLIFLRYFIGFLILCFAVITESWLVFAGSLVFVIIYCIWAIVKSYRYVEELQAFYLLPAIQLTSDIAVMLGSLKGWLPHKWDTARKS